MPAPIQLRRDDLRLEAQGRTHPETDPWGVKNLIADPAHADTLTCLRKEFTDWRKATDDLDIHPRLITRRA